MHGLPCIHSPALPYLCCDIQLCLGTLSLGKVATCCPTPTDALTVCCPCRRSCSLHGTPLH